MKNKENEEKNSLADYGIVFLSGSIAAAIAQNFYRISLAFSYILQENEGKLVGLLFSSKSALKTLHNIDHVETDALFL